LIGKQMIEHSDRRAKVSTAHPAEIHCANSCNATFHNIRLAKVRCWGKVQVCFSPIVLIKPFC
jgi:hypothetical protein